MKSSDHFPNAYAKNGKVLFRINDRVAVYSCHESLSHPELAPYDQRVEGIVIAITDHRLRVQFKDPCALWFHVKQCRRIINRRKWELTCTRVDYWDGTTFQGKKYEFCAVDGPMVQVGEKIEVIEVKK